MDWMAVTNEVRAQVARSGEALIPWSIIEHAAKTIPNGPISLPVVKNPGEELSPLGWLKLLAEQEGNLDFTIDFSSKLVHLKRPMGASPGMG
ncbi:MAG: hypothetical protein IPP78_08540 [Holophagaceae bacterium]|nr:hypothetical protein [Holophagaceae bacterium]